MIKKENEGLYTNKLETVSSKNKGRGKKPLKNNWNKNNNNKQKGNEKAKNGQKS